MNQGGDAADQVIRYSLDGTEIALKLSGLAAKNLALFLVALLKDQKKSRGKTRVLRMVKDGRSTRFFSVPSERMQEFSREAKMRGLLFAGIRDRKKPDNIEIMVFADDAAKASRVMDAMGLDFLASQSASMETQITEQTRGAQPAVQSKTETVETQKGAVVFETGELEDLFSVGAQRSDENFTPARENGTAEPMGKNPSEPSSRSSALSPQPAADKENDEKPSVRKELEGIKKEQAQAKKDAPQKARGQQKSTPTKQKTKKQTKGR